MKVTAWRLYSSRPKWMVVPLLATTLLAVTAVLLVGWICAISQSTPFSRQWQTIEISTTTCLMVLVDKSCTQTRSFWQVESGDFNGYNARKPTWQDKLSWGPIGQAIRGNASKVDVSGLQCSFGWPFRSVGYWKPTTSPFVVGGWQPLWAMKLLTVPPGSRWAIPGTIIISGFIADVCCFAIAIIMFLIGFEMWRRQYCRKKLLCPDCGYSLVGIIERVTYCPECGCSAKRTAVVREA